MTTRRLLVVFAVILGSPSADARAQKSSIAARQEQVQAGLPQPTPPRESNARPRNPVYDRYSWISIPAPRPKAYRPGDLITIIVRERRKFEADADLQSRKGYKLETELDAFLKLTGGGLGSAAFQRGKPNIDYEIDHTLRSTGDTSREDRLTTRLSAIIVDVKPNGLLVLAGRAKITHDDEVSAITFTGTCRKEDVTANNTILSTQIADKEVVVTNQGAMRAVSTRGWVHRLVDLIKPF